MNKPYRVIPGQFVTIEEVIIALRSNQYKQGRHNLYEPFNDCYCVVGVIAKLAGFNEDHLKIRCYLSDLYISFVYDYTKPVNETLRCMRHFERLLTQYNDSDYLSFDEISYKFQCDDDSFKDLTNKIPKVEFLINK